MRFVTTLASLTAVAGALALNGTATAAPPPGYIEQAGNVMIAQPHTQTTGVVSCPAATVPLGGGAVAAAPALAVNASYPSGNRWVARVNNSSNTAASFVVQALCADKPSGYQILRKSVIAAPGIQTFSLELPCPAATLPLGGGAVAGSASTAVSLNGSWPMLDGWDADFNNRTNASVTITTYAVCGIMAGYQRIPGQVVLTGLGTTTSLAGCPAATVPIGGGGYSSSYSTRIDLNTTAAATDAAGDHVWVAVEQNSDPSDLNNTVQAFAICAGT